MTKSSAVRSMTSRTTSSSATRSPAIDRLFEDAGVSSSITKDGWCLKQGLEHLSTVDQARTAPLIQRHGIPSFYSCCKGSASKLGRHSATQDIKDPNTCFESLCRIIAGQSVSGKSAQAVWKRLLATTSHDLTPSTILGLAQSGDLEGTLQKPAGLSRAKTNSIVDLAERFSDNRLSEEYLVSSEEDDVRQALLQVKGLGPWSCDMFLMFYLERPNVLPLGDLGTRKGIVAHFSIKGSLDKGQLCPKKDAERVRKQLEPYSPYLSLLTYFLWRAADTPADKKPSHTTKSKQATRRPNKTESPSTPTTATRRVRRRVTP